MNSFPDTFVLGTILLFVGCATPPPELTSLEIQAIQKRSFDADKETTFNSVVSVLQDLGHVINNADIETGLIQASSPANRSTDWLTGGSWTTFIEVSAFVEEIQGKTSVRLNYVSTAEEYSPVGMSGRGQRPLFDAGVYNRAFMKIQEAIFIRQVNSE